MRKIHLFAAAAAAVASLSSCNRESLPSGQKENVGEMVELTVSLPDVLKSLSASLPQTKAESGLDAGTDSERNVKSLQVYVFNEAGTRIEAYGKAENTTSVSISVALGKKTIAAVVNAADIKDVITLEQLKAKTTDLEDNAPDAFVMFGTVNKEVAASGSIEVPVSRIASRVVLGEIVNAMVLDQYKNLPIKLQRIYLVNAGGKTDLQSVASPSSDQYYNKMKAEAGSPVLLSKTFGTAPEITSSSPYTSETRLYCYPNPVTEDSDAETWSPRLTRLVVEVKLDGNTWFYPLTIPGPIQSNMSYEIPRLTITRPGSTSADDPIELGTANFSVEVSPWTVNSLAEVEI